MNCSLLSMNAGPQHGEKRLTPSPAVLQGSKTTRVLASRLWPEVIRAAGSGASLRRIRMLVTHLVAEVSAILGKEKSSQPLPPLELQLELQLLQRVEVPRQIYFLVLSPFPPAAAYRDSAPRLTFPESLLATWSAAEQYAPDSEATSGPALWP